MRRFLSFLGLASIALVLIVSCNNSNDSGDDSPSPKKRSKKTKLGMKFETEERLGRIPKALIPFGGDELPASVDLSPDMPEVGNQGEQQSCVAWALAYALKSYQEKKETGKQLLFSPSFVYNQINGGENAPTYVTDGLAVLSQQGACLMEDMPYDANTWTETPDTKARRSARRFRIDYWKQVEMEDLRQVKAQLAAGYPIVIGANVSEEFMMDGYTKKEKYVWKKKGRSIGGHAMVVVGYSDSKKAFKLMNSWGKEWGDQGYGWVSYSLFPEVVQYGFIAKDGYTDQGALDNPNNRPSPATSSDSIEFHQTNVEYGVTIEGEPQRGEAMKIEGTLDIPPGFGKKFQIVVHVYNAETNEQVKSLIYPDYADINHFAAGYTNEYDIEENGFRQGTWWLHIPYSAMDVPAGKTTNLYAIPTLFVDNFGVAVGERVDFWMKK
jgi:hypothetical protein